MKMPDVVRVRALRVEDGRSIAEEALAKMIGTPLLGAGRVVAAQVVDGWLVLDIDGVKFGTTIYTSPVTGEQYLDPPVTEKDQP